MHPLQAHCHLGLGTLYATTDQRQRAWAALSTATEMYRAMAMTLWLPQAEAALAQTGEAARPAGASPEAWPQGQSRYEVILISG
jgi:hypothetical protein